MLDPLLRAGAAIAYDEPRRPDRHVAQALDAIGGIAHGVLSGGHARGARVRVVLRESHGLEDRMRRHRVRVVEAGAAVLAEESAVRQDRGAQGKPREAPVVEMAVIVHGRPEAQREVSLTRGVVCGRGRLHRARRPSRLAAPERRTVRLQARGRLTVANRLEHAVGTHECAEGAALCVENGPELSSGLLPEPQVVHLVGAALLAHHPAGLEDIGEVALEALEGDVDPLLLTEGLARLHERDVRHRAVVVHGEVRGAGIAPGIHVGCGEALRDGEQARIVGEVVEAVRHVEPGAELSLRPAHGTA